MRSRSFSFVLAALVAGCSSAPTPVAPGPGDAPAVGPQDGNVVMAAPDTSPVAAPRSLVLVVRASSPKQTVEAVEKLVPLPEKIFSLLEKESDGLSKYLDYSESFDLAIGLDPASRDIDDPKFLIGFSAPLATDYKPLLDMAEKEGNTVRQVGPGSYRIEGRGARDLSCETLSVSGRAPRLVCAEGQAAFRELAGYLGRTLPAEPPRGDDVWMQANFGPFRELIVGELRREMDRGLGEVRRELEQQGVRDPELLDAPATMARELLLALEDVDRFEMGLKLDAQKPEVRATAELLFRGNQAWATKVLTGANAKKSLPPEQFWRMAADADSAFFGHSADPALFVGVRRTTKKAIAQGLDIAGQFAGGLLTDADKQAFVALFDTIPVGGGGVWATSTGTLAPLPGGAPAGQKPASFTTAQAVAEARNKVRGFIGWSVMSTDGDIRQMQAFLKSLNDAYARGLGMVKREADQKLARAPQDMKKFYQERRAELNRAPTVKFVADPPGYPKGSAELAFDFELQSDDVWSWVHPDQSWDSRPEHPKGRPAKGKISVRVAVIPDGPGRYLWGYAADDKALKDRLLAAQSGSPKDKTLASRTDLDRLKVPATQAGFINYGRIVANLAELDEHDRDLRDMKQAIAVMPNKAAAPVFFVGGGNAGAAPSIQASLTMDRRWVDDIRALVQFAMGQGSGSALKVPSAREEAKPATPKPPRK